MTKKTRHNGRPASDAPIVRIERPLTLIAQAEQALRRAVDEGVFAGGKLPTAVELAELLGVSRETVRLALDTLQRKGLLIKRRRRGTFLSAGDAPRKLQSVAKIVGYLQADYSRENGGPDVITRSINSVIFDGALAEAGNAGYLLVARSARIARLRQAYDDMSAQLRLAGVMFASIAEEKLLRRLGGRNMPVVLVDHDLHLPKISSIQPDSFGRGRMAVAQLAALGHRRIALAHWQQHELNPWLLRGYREGMRDHALRCRRDWELFVSISPEGAREVVDALLKLNSPPTAVICFSNALANFVIEAAAARGLRVPDDLSVVGGGGGEVLGLTCTQLDWYELGRSAMKLLLQAIDDGEQTEPRHEVMPYAWQPGRTCRSVE